MEEGGTEGPAKKKEATSNTNPRTLGNKPPKNLNEQFPIMYAMYPNQKTKQRLVFV